MTFGVVFCKNLIQRLQDIVFVKPGQVSRFEKGKAYSIVFLRTQTVANFLKYLHMKQIWEINTV